MQLTEHIHAIVKTIVTSMTFLVNVANILVHILFAAKWMIHVGDFTGNLLQFLMQLKVRINLLIFTQYYSFFLEKCIYSESEISYISYFILFLPIASCCVR